MSKSVRVGEGETLVQHARPRPLDQSLPHLAHEDQRHVLDVPHLQQLPDHQHLEHGADAAGHDDEGVGGEHEMMETREEGLVHEGLLDKRVHILLERQFDADPHEPGAPALFAPSLAACIRPGPPPVTMSQPIDANAAEVRFTSS